MLDWPSDAGDASVRDMNLSDGMGGRRFALGACVCLGLMACDDKDALGGGQAQDDGTNGQCEETVMVLADLTATTALGVAPQELADAVVLPDAGEVWTWADPTVADGEFVVVTNATPGDTTLQISVASVGEARLVASEPKLPEPGTDAPSIYPICNDRIELDVTLAIATEDGMLDEAGVAATLRYESDEEGISTVEGMRVSASVPLEMSTLEGALEVVSESPEALDSVVYALDLALGGTEGGAPVLPEISLNALGEGSDGNIAWAAFYMLGSLPGL